MYFEEYEPWARNYAANEQQRQNTFFRFVGLVRSKLTKFSASLVQNLKHLIDIFSKSLKEDRMIVVRRVEVVGVEVWGE